MKHEFTTVMHELKRRSLTVKHTEWPASNLKRITFTGEDLKDFNSLSADDHVKVFIPLENGDSAMRDYTPKRFDPKTRELELEFFMNGKGPAATWAKNAEVGDTIVIGGPKGSRIVPYDFDWYLMIGDETSIPSFTRRLEELPSGSRVEVFIEVADEKQILKTYPQIHWILRNGETSGESSRITNALKTLSFPEGEYFTWVALEKNATMEIENYLINEKATNPDWIRAKGYWNKDKKH